MSNTKKATIKDYGLNKLQLEEVVKNENYSNIDESFVFIPDSEIEKFLLFREKEYAKAKYFN